MDQASAKSRAPVGVLGGLGPLASAEFLKTIYEQSLGEREQDSPNVVLLSDPAFPDRTSAILDGNEALLLDPLTDSLRQLVDLGAEKIVICCMTIHAVLHRVPQDLRSRVISLLDVIYDSVGRSGERHLVLCTKGTRQMKLFEKHSGWEASRDRLVMPADSDQDTIHQMIYRLKSNSSPANETPILHRLLEEYASASFVSGCTEIHLLVKRMIAARKCSCVDPLLIIAQRLAQGRL
jgi:aspartate racemase